MSRFRQSLHPLKQKIADLEFILGKAEIKSWAAVQEIVRAGLAKTAFNIGDQFVSKYGDSLIVWDVIGIDHDIPTDPQYTHSLTLQTHDCIRQAIMMDSAEPSNPDENRATRGNNRYIYSGMRQWLNSFDEVFEWTAQHEYDTNTPYKGAGFLYLLDAELVAVLGSVNKQVARHSVDGGGQDIFSDKVFLLSPVEVGGVITTAARGNTMGEMPYAWYSSLPGTPTDGSLDGRIKYYEGDIFYQWLRSPEVRAASSHFACISIDGSVYRYGYYANLGANFCIAPAVCVV